MKILKKLEEIIQGWKNLTLNKEVDLSKSRLTICSSCSLNTNGVCNRNLKGKAVTTFLYNDEIRNLGKEYNGCGCPLKAKTSSPNTKCPLGKW